MIHTRFDAKLQSCQSTIQVFEPSMQTNFVKNYRNIVYACRSMRYECLQLARQHSAAFLQLYLQCSVSTAIARNASRSSHAWVPDAVIAKMANVLEEPDGCKHAWEKNVLTINTCDINLLSNVVRYNSQQLNEECLFHVFCTPRCLMLS